MSATVLTDQLAARGTAAPAPVRSDFDLDLTVEVAGQHPDTLRIFASATEAPCQCSSDQCH